MLQYIRWCCYMYYNFTKDINYAKIVLGLNDNELSKYLNISRMTLNRWQNNKVVPNYDSLEKIYNKFYSDCQEIFRNGKICAEF